MAARVFKCVFCECVPVFGISGDAQKRFRQRLGIRRLKEADDGIVEIKVINFRLGNDYGHAFAT